MYVEEDGDEILTPMSSVRCCFLRWEGATAIYSELRPVPRYGKMYMCCSKCGSSYGEVFTPTEEGIRQLSPGSN